MKLNPEKCTFALDAGKFLNLLFSYWEIEVNSEKIKAIKDMQPPKTIKDIQKLTGSLAALRRFIAKLADHCLPLFDNLKEVTTSKNITWMKECQKAFEDLKKYLSLPPLLAVAAPIEPLSLYLSASDKDVRADLIKDTNGQ